jgi:endonuclease/exonuclease/phosphatase family metal-dependent hydrolase
MPRRFLALLLAAASVAGGWAFLKNFRIEGLEHVVVRPASETKTGDPSPPPLTERTSGTIRVASFNIQVFGESKFAKPRVMGILADIVRKFDVVAIQEVRTKSQDLLPRFVELVNSTGRKYDYAIGPRLGRTNSKEQYAFIFDAASIEIDRTALYTITAPDELIHRKPLVGWFRVRGPSPDESFTFTLINVHTDPDEVQHELAALDDIYRAVRDDGRSEDDTILLGDLNTDDAHLGQLGEVSDIAAAISGVATNTRGDKLYDNLLFTRTATKEFTGRSGVLDLLRQYNMTVEQALEVSDHLPVWAEFSIYEGGRPGRVAARPDKWRQ